MKTIIIILIILLLFINIKSIPMLKKLTPGQTYCFSDDIPQYTLIKLKTNVQTPIQIQIYSQNQIIKNKQLIADNIQTWTTQKYGIFKFCFKNYQQSVGILKYDYAVGQRANDYTSSYDGEDYLKSLQTQANIANMFVDEIEKQNIEGFSKMVHDNMAASSYTCVYMLSTFFVSISLILTVVQFKMVKKYLHNRKYL